MSHNVRGTGVADGVRDEVTASDGVRLAVWRHGDPAAPTVVAVHGYPDDHTVWDGVVAALRDRHHVVVYDVRGAGASGAPSGAAGYDLEQLASDLSAVLDAVSPTAPVHLLAHDWGAIQSWHAVTGALPAERIASFTSISGPCLDHVGLFLRRRSPRDLPAVLRQAAHSWYTALFRMPVLPELLWRSGLAGRVVAGIEGVPRPSVRDGVNGLELYRRNLPRHLADPQPRTTTVPVQVLAPREDRYVTPALAVSAARFTPDLRVRRLPGGHWVVRSRPDVIARCVAELAAHVDGGAEAPSLARARSRSRWDGALVVVTGAGSGIGRATAHAFARRGARVVVADRDADAAARTAAAIGDRAFPAEVDVADEDAVAALAARVAESHGVPDVVVNNAGIAVAGPFAETTADEWRRIVDVNLWGVVHGSRHFGALMRAHGEGGHLVTVASAAAYLPSRELSAYATTKAAVLMLSECLRAELGDDGIGVTAVCPGFVNTAITSSARFAGLDDAAQRRARERTTAQYTARGYAPERVAEQLVRAVERNAPLLPVTPEARAGLLAARLSPALVRAVARLDIGPR